MITQRLQLILGTVSSVLLVALALQSFIPIELTFLEAIAIVSYAWSVWLLAHNQPLGWPIGLIGTVLYGIVFYQVRLFAEVGLQVFYFLTSLQALYIWLHGGENHTEKPVERLPRKWQPLIAGIAIVSIILLRQRLIAIGGAAPFWDALTTVTSIIAHLLLMGRFVESWYLWITVDIIYVPLYASRQLYATSILYAIFCWMAMQGLRNFQALDHSQSRSTSLDAP